jgi:hypothetical protein
MTVEHTLAYYVTTIITSVKNFKVPSPDLRRQFSPFKKIASDTISSKL